jgi:myosin heavy subunit
MRRTGADQAVVMSGESGAGKTETTKHLMMYIARRAAKEGQLEAISDAIIRSNPITEAFGNARSERPGTRMRA